MIILKIPHQSSRTFYKSPKSNLFVWSPIMLHWNTWKKCIREAGLAGRGNSNPKVKFNIPQEKLASPDWPFKEAVNEIHWRVCYGLMEQLSENQCKSFVCNITQKDNLIRAPINTLAQCIRWCLSQLDLGHCWRSTQMNSLGSYAI